MRSARNQVDGLPQAAWGDLSQEPGGSQRYTHKTSGFKTSGFKTSGFKTSEMSGLQNVNFTKHQVYKMSGLQNIRSSKHPVAKKHPYKFCTCGWWKSAGSVAAMFACTVMAVFYSLFLEGFLPYNTIMVSNKEEWHTLYFKYECKLDNSYTFCLINISNLKSGRFEIRRFETWRFVNLTFCKPDVLKPDVLKPDILQPDVLQPDVLWVYRHSRSPRS